MKRPLTLVFLFVSIFCAPADQPCSTTECEQDDNGDWTIQKIADCPEDKPCTRTKHHQFDPELDKRKNIWRDDQQPVLQSIRWIKGLETADKA